MSDDGSMHALEALAIVMITTLSIGFVVLTTDSAPAAAADEIPRRHLAHDFLAVLSKPAGASPLDRYVPEAIAGDDSNLSRHLDRILPPGMGWELYVHNGVAPRTLARGGWHGDGGATSSELMLPATGTRSIAYAPVECVAGTANTTLRVDVVPFRTARLDPDASSEVRFSNGHAAIAPRDGWRLVANVSPALPGGAGHDVPYDLASPEAHATSVEAAAGSAAVPHRATAGDATFTYTVHPHCANEDLASALDQPGRIEAPALANPGTDAMVTFTFADLPLPAGAAVWSATVEVREPYAGTPVAAADLASASGTWTWSVPRDALYGTHLVHVRLTSDGPIPQTVEQVAAIDVVPPGATAATTPVHRVGLVLWN